MSMLRTARIIPGLAGRLPGLRSRAPALVSTPWLWNRSFSRSAPSLTEGKLPISSIPTLQSATPVIEPHAASVVEASSEVLATDPSSLISASMHALGDLKAAGLASSWTPVGWIQSALELIHVSTGLPWWASIALVTVLIRGAMVPLMIKLQRHTATLHNIRPEMDKMMAELQKAKAAQDMQKLGQASQQIEALFKKHNTHPLKALGTPLIQMPIMISFFLGIRRIAEANVESFHHGGALWFTDLSVADPTYALPVIASAGFLAVLELGGEMGVSNPQADKFRNIFRIATVGMIPFTAMMPSGVFVYWITSNAFTLAQTLALKNESVRDHFKIPRLVKHAPVDPSGLQKPMGFMDGFRAAMDAKKPQPGQEPVKF